MKLEMSVCLLCAGLCACSIQVQDGDGGLSPVDGLPGRRSDAGAPDARAETSGVTWIAIPAGVYEMGCSPGDGACMPDELPRHGVAVSAFQMTETEVTQAQYRSVMGDNPSRSPACDECPVDGLTWKEADRFCKSIGGRLPTEAEWEYAARANVTARYSCGGDASCLASIAWYKADAGGAAHAVRAKKPNGFGLYDMLGNMLEFVADWYAEDYYARSPTRNPAGPEGGLGHVLRGGAWGFDSEFVRVSLRNIDTEPVLKSSYLGARCARDEK